MNSPPDDLSLLLGVGHTRQLVEEPVGRIDVDQVGVHIISEDFDDLLRLTLSEEAVVDVHADELLADRLDEQGCDDAAVDTAGECKENFLVPDLILRQLDLLCDERIRLLLRGDARHPVRSSDLCYIHIGWSFLPGQAFL